MTDKNVQEVLFKANTLIKSHVSMTSNEYKIFNTILYKCQKNKNENNQMVASVTIDELKKFTKNRSEATPKGILETLETFLKIPIKFEINEKYVVVPLISRVEIDKEIGVFRCFLYEDLYNILINYNNIGYSPIDLKLVRSAKGYYTQRLYELFRIWSGTKKEATYTIKELKKMLKIETNTSYDRYYNFKTRIIAPALKEINSKLNMNVEFVENKAGISVTSLTFTVVDNEPRRYNFENKNNQVVHKVDYNSNKYPKDKLKSSNFTEREFDYNSLQEQFLESQYNF